MIKLKNILICFLFSQVLIACNGDKEKPKNEIKTNERDSAVLEETSTINIISGTPDFEMYRPKSSQKDTILFIEESLYTLSYSANLDTTKKLHWVEIYMDNWEEQKEFYHGYEVNYSIVLTNNTNNQEVFSTSFTKDFFKSIADTGLLTASYAYLPEFIGYLPTFKSFLFTIEFWFPESDVGSQVFFMLNETGGFKELFLNNYYGGADCDGNVEISPSEDFILTCRKIINVNGKSIKINNDKYWQVGTRLINENTILVIQEHNDTNNINNAYLINNFGRNLKSFSYTGYYNTLGFSVPCHHDTRTRELVLVDDDKKNIRVINDANPIATYTVDFDEMELYDGKRRKNEIVFDINTLFGKYTFGVDTFSHKFRYTKSK